MAEQTPLLPFRRQRPSGTDNDRSRERPPAPQRMRVANGRAWINGREVGGTDPRFAHLDDTHD